MEGKRIPVSFRLTPQTKRALALAAEFDQRSQTNLVEKLVFDFCRKSGIKVGLQAEEEVPRKSQKLQVV